MNWKEKKSHPGIPLEHAPWALVDPSIRSLILPPSWILLQNPVDGEMRLEILNIVQVTENFIYSTAQIYVNCAYAVYTHIRVCSYAHTRMNAYTCASAFPLLFSTINFLCVALLCKTKHFWIWIKPRADNRKFTYSKSYHVTNAQVASHREFTG